MTKWYQSPADEKIKTLVKFLFKLFLLNTLELLTLNIQVIFSFKLEITYFYLKKDKKIVYIKMSIQMKIYYVEEIFKIYFN